MDTIADMLTRVRNALKARKEVVEVPYSRIKVEIARVLKEEGYISNFKVFDNKKFNVLRILLRYDANRAPVINTIQRVSKCSSRVYCGYEALDKIQGSFGVAILSTSRGILADRQARQQKVGGEVLARVW